MSSSSTIAEKKITLRSSDGEAFEVEEKVATESQTIKHMIEDDYSEIPLPNVTSNILTLVIEYCKKHIEAAADPVPETSYPSLNDKTHVDPLTAAWDAEFVKVDQNTLFDLIVVCKNKPLCPFILLSPFVLRFSFTALCFWVVVQFLLLKISFLGFCLEAEKTEV